MSGIAGILYQNGSAVRDASLHRMLAAIAHRGTDGAAVWTGESVGLGCRQLLTTPEGAAQRHLPALTRDDCRVLTADIRLDNRELLRTELALSVAADSVTDEEVLLAAYRKWGERCVERFLGDFAFAIWDEPNRRLFCARDHFGVRPFYYHYRAGRLFAFASEVKALLTLESVPRAINEQRVGDYLAGIVCDTESTYYRDIHRLPPGRFLLVTPDGLRMTTYWRLERSDECSRVDGAYADAFRETLSDAVRVRLRSSTAVGSLLSGGLDSSSITALAHGHLERSAGGRLHTFSTVFDQLSECDESSLIRQVLARGSYEGHFINGDGCDHIGQLANMVRQCDGPFPAPNAAMRWRQMAEINRRGIKVVLEGTGGDETVSHGYGYVDDLARDGRWLKLARELSGLTQIHGDSFLAWYWLLLVKHHLWPAWSGSLARRALRRGRRALIGSPGPRRESEPKPWGPLIDEGFARRIDLADRYRHWRRSLPESAKSERDRHFRVLTGALQPMVFEVLDALGAAFSIETRLPFWDRRLVELCVNMPPDEKLRSGWGRSVMRRAMEPLLPADVVWRRSKTNFLPSLRRALYSDGRSSMAMILEHSDLLDPFVDVAAFRAAYARIAAKRERCAPEDVFRIWSAAGLALWLREEVGRPSEKTTRRVVSGSPHSSQPALYGSGGVV